MLFTTLLAIKEHNPCFRGWSQLRAHLGPDWPHNKRIPLSRILDSNGLDDAIWALRVLPDKHRPLIVEFACRCAERVLPIFEKAHPDDDRPRKAIKAARKYANGEITLEEVREAYDAAAYTAADARAVAAVYAAHAAAYAAHAAADARAHADTAADAAARAAADARAVAAVYAAHAAADAAGSEGAAQAEIYRSIF